MDQKPFKRFLRAAPDHLGDAAAEQHGPFDQRETAEPHPIAVVFPLMRSHASLRAHIPLDPLAQSISLPRTPREDIEVTS